MAVTTELIEAKLKDRLAATAVVGGMADQSLRVA